MPNQPRDDNPARQVRVEDQLWDAAGKAAARDGTTRSEVMREALRELVKFRELVDSTPPEGDAS